MQTKIRNRVLRVCWGFVTGSLNRRKEQERNVTWVHHMYRGAADKLRPDAGVAHQVSAPTCYRWLPESLARISFRYQSPAERFLSGRNWIFSVFFPASWCDTSMTLFSIMASIRESRPVPPASWVRRSHGSTVLFPRFFQGYVIVSVLYTWGDKRKRQPRARKGYRHEHLKTTPVSTNASSSKNFPLVLN